MLCGRLSLIFQKLNLNMSRLISSNFHEDHNYVEISYITNQNQISVMVDLSNISFGIKIRLTDFFRLYAGKPALHKFSMKSSIIF